MKKSDATIMIDDYEISKRPNIKPQEKIRLWVHSGGRCAICNKYLLDLDYNVSIGEMAHIVGWNKAAKSPRGLADLPLEDRNTADNLILLCAEHHKIVDNKELLQEFTLERLMKHKIDHEKRIFHLTSLQIDAQSVVIRMLGGIRGAAVEVSKEHVRNVVFNSEQKFAMFLDSYDKHGIEIDLTGLPEPDENWESYWTIGEGIIDKCLLLLHEGVAKGGVRHQSVFALSRIPLLVYLGYKLGDKVPLTLYQKHRGEDETWMWSDKEKAEAFEVVKLQEYPSAEVVLLLSISGSIDFASLPTPIVKGRNVYMIRPVAIVPNRNIFRNKATFENFCKTYYFFLSDLEVNHKSCDTIHLIGAVPVTASIACGRGIMRDAQPALTIYDLIGSTYKPAITINKK
jgi:hypothetical protein